MFKAVVHFIKKITFDDFYINITIIFEDELFRNKLFVNIMFLQKIYLIFFIKIY